MGFFVFNLDNLQAEAVDLLGAPSPGAPLPDVLPPDALVQDQPDLEEDSGEVPVGWGPLRLRFHAPDEEEEEEVVEDWDDADSEYGSLSEEEEEEEAEVAEVEVIREEEDEEMEVVEEDDQCLPPEEWCVGWRAPPAQAVESVGLPQIPVPQQRAESPPQASREDVSQPSDLGQLSPARPSASSALDFLSIVFSKRSRDEEEKDSEEDSKRPRLSSFEEHPDGPSSSRSFTQYFLWSPPAPGPRVGRGLSFSH